MSENRKRYARYFYIHDFQTYWRGDPAVDGSAFRTIALTSESFNATVGPCQVLMLEGTGKGVENGKFVGAHDGTKAPFDEDFAVINDGRDKFRELSEQTLNDGFRPITIWDMIVP